MSRWTEVDYNLPFESGQHSGDDQQGFGGRRWAEMTTEEGADRLPDEREIIQHADNLISRFSINGGREDLLGLALACDQFDDALGRAAGLEIKRRALLLED